MPGSKESIKKAKLAYRNRPAKLFTEYPRCPGCGSMCANQKSLEDHMVFCDGHMALTAKRRGFVQGNPPKFGSQKIAAQPFLFSHFQNLDLDA